MAAMLAHKQILFVGIAIAGLVLYMAAPMPGQKTEQTTTTTIKNTVAQKTITKNTQIPCLSDCNITNPLPDHNLEEHKLIDVRRHFSLAS
jgi:hypothetical protein